MAPFMGAHHLMRPGGGRGVLVAGVPGVPRPGWSSWGPGWPAWRRPRWPSGCTPTSTSSTATSSGCARSTTTSAARWRRWRRAPTPSRRRASTPTSSSGPCWWSGAKAPELVSDDLVARMNPGSVLVDISVDQGDASSRPDPTTHSDPTFRGRRLALLLRGQHARCRAPLFDSRPGQRHPALRVDSPATGGGPPSDDPALAKGVNVAGGGGLSAGGRGARPQVHAARPGPLSSRLGGAGPATPERSSLVPGGVGRVTSCPGGGDG